MSSRQRISRSTSGASTAAPTLGYPAPMHGSLRAMLQFAGATVDGETSAVYRPCSKATFVISIGPAVTAMRTHPASVLREE